MVDEYAFVPSKEFLKVEKDIQKIKQNPLVDDAKSTELSKSITSLNSAVGEMLSIFKQANEELTLEEREAKIIQEQLKPVSEKLEELGRQNEILANGIVAVADSVAEVKSQLVAMQKQILLMRSEPSPIQQQVPNTTMPSSFNQFGQNQMNGQSNSQSSFANSAQNSANQPFNATTNTPPGMELPTIAPLKPNQLAQKKPFI